ncbi:MAG TPA: flagellar hook-basal body complex protein FliE [Verrucomicrobiae bacterium]|nr:flagellar hook-basal body complex protein FliE [Verrucomicrobiae bacterium]
MSPLSSISAYLQPNGLIQFLPQANQLKSAIPAAETPTTPEIKTVSGTDSTGSFSSALSRAVDEINAKQTAASDAVNGLISGQGVSLHQAMISMQEASVSFQLMVEVRNKLLESYQELMRMQV